MKVGDRVKVVKSVVVYHSPHAKEKGEGFDVQGMEGEIEKVIKELHGSPISANLPILVKFDKRFKGHFREDELEVI